MSVTDGFLLRILQRPHLGTLRCRGEPSTPTGMGRQLPLTVTANVRREATVTPHYYLHRESPRSTMAAEKPIVLSWMSSISLGGTRLSHLSQEELRSRLQPNDYRD